MTNFRFALSARTFGAVLALLVLAGCGGVALPSFFGDGPQSAIVATAPRPQADARGVITYPTYQVAVARSDDTITTIADRIGVQPGDLARRNGFPVGYRPLPGEILALPVNVGGTLAGTDTPWTPELAANAIRNSGAGTGNPFTDGSGPEGALEPLRHTVAPGDTAFTIARRYNVSVTALASWNGLGSNLEVRPGRTLLIPVPASRGAAAQQATATIAAAELPGAGSQVAPPPSAEHPLPDDIAAVEPPPSPNLGALRTTSSAQFLAPVSGKIIKPYSTKPGAARNEGVDFAAAAGTIVKAAGDGEVALVSESVDGLGTIVLIRHDGNLLTVYGRVTGVIVKKGDQVKRGQKIGVVAGGDNPSLHFEVRRGTEALDPTPFF